MDALEHTAPPLEVITEFSGLARDLGVLVREYAFLYWDEPLLTRLLGRTLRHDFARPLKLRASSEYSELGASYDAFERAATWDSRLARHNLHVSWGSSSATCGTLGELQQTVHRLLLVMGIRKIAFHVFGAIRPEHGGYAIYTATHDFPGAVNLQHHECEKIARERAPSNE